MSQPPEGRVPTPGEKLADGEIFCADDCEHSRCRWFRELAASACVYCGKALGAGARYYALMCGVAHPMCHGYAARVGRAKQ